MIDVLQRDLIASAFQSAIDEVVIEHYPSLTQEAQLTSRIAQRVEDRLNNLRLAGATLRVVTQELPDRGRGAAEVYVGADLLVTITLENEFSKGFLVQSKWRNKHDPAVFAEQCAKMLAISKASYGWEYGQSGTHVYNAKRIVTSPDYHRRHFFEYGRRLQTVIRRVLICKEGDPALGIPFGADPRSHVGLMIRELAAKAALSLRIET
jgi:N-acetylmuramoyl-L-alanine amidase